MKGYKINEKPSKPCDCTHTHTHTRVSLIEDKNSKRLTLQKVMLFLI